MTEMVEKAVVLQYALNPTKDQEQDFRSHAGAARYSYNYALDVIYKNWGQVKNGETEDYITPTLPTIRKIFNQEKAIIAPWWKDNGKNAYDTGFANAATAFQKFFKKQTKQPKFKSRNNEKLSFDNPSNTRKLEETRRHFTIARIGTIKLHERANKLAYLLRHGGRITNVNINYSRTRWFLNVTVRVVENLWQRFHLLRTKKDKKRVVGVDLGIKTAAVFSDGTVIENPKAYEKELRNLRRLNKELSRRRKHNKATGEVASNRYDKTRKKLRKSYAKVTNQEVDFAHKLSKQLVDNYGTIGMEDLNVAGMVRNRKLARRIAHASFGRLREFVSYKAGWYGNELVLVDRFFPSSKTCSSCGTVRAKLSLSERTFECFDCGFTIDRDLNAAINIEKEALRLLSLEQKEVAQSCGETKNGRGEESAGGLITKNVKLSSLKRQVKPVLQQV